MNTSDFEFLRAMIRQKSGIAVNPDKSYLIESRLMPVARQWGHGDIASLVVSLRGLADPKLTREVIEAVTQNDTAFYRDWKVFTHLAERIVPALVQARAGPKKLRVWSAATSTGQEAYSLAMLLKDKGVYGPNWTINILASDIDQEVLGRAAKASYSQFEVQRGLPVRALVEHFTKDGERWHVKDAIRKLVKFQPFNLIERTDPLGEFDLILMRNVLTHFDEATRLSVLQNIAKRMAKDAVLLLGVKETLPEGVKDLAKLGPVPGVYALSNSPLLRKFA